MRLISGISGSARRRSERGAAMAEFAILLPVLSILLFGIVEFGLLLYDQAVITNASRVGARFATAYDPLKLVKSPSDVCDAVRDYVYSPNATAVNRKLILATFPKREFTCADVAPVPEGEPGTFKWTVTVTYPYNFLVLSPLIRLFDPDFPGTLNLTARTVMRNEYQEEVP